MSADNVLKSLGLEGAVEVSVDDWKALPSNRRHSLTGPPPEHRSVFLRLADPPAVAALRRIADQVEQGMSSAGRPTVALSNIDQVAQAALAEFDGASS